MRRLLTWTVVLALLVVAGALTAVVLADRRARSRDEVRFVEVPFVAPNFGAVTAGRIVFIQRGRADDADLVAHELVHVCQWEEEGVEFLWNYLSEYAANAAALQDARQAYQEISYEEQARAGSIDCDLETYLVSEPATTEPPS